MDYVKHTILIDRLGFKNSRRFYRRRIRETNCRSAQLDSKCYAVYQIFYFHQTESWEGGKVLQRLQQQYRYQLSSKYVCTVFSTEGGLKISVKLFQTLKIFTHTTTYYVCILQYIVQHHRKLVATEVAKKLRFSSPCVTRLLQQFRKQTVL